MRSRRQPARSGTSTCSPMCSSGSSRMIQPPGPPLPRSKGPPKSMPRRLAARACKIAGRGLAISSPSMISPTTCGGRATRSAYVAVFFTASTRKYRTRRAVGCRSIPRWEGRLSTCSGWRYAGPIVSAIVLPGVVPPDVLGQLRARMAAGPLISGKRTAVGRAAAIKNNLILTPDSASAAGAVELLAGVLSANVGFQVATWPEAMLPPMFCRYEVGMGYGDHVDAAVMGDGTSQMRCDVSLTVCLNDASEYDGGELVIDAAGAPSLWKGNAGDVIVYPSDT